MFVQATFSQRHKISLIQFKGGDTMGLRCSCGAIVGGTDEVIFTFLEGEISSSTGQGTYTANVCADRLGFSSFELVFVDTDDIAPNNSFTFTSTSIQSVECQQIGEACRIEVSGLGIVAGEVEPRQFTAIFLDNPVIPVNNDIAIVTIDGFAVQNSLANLPQGSITALGCGIV
jgi:hypothetical protein